MQDNKKLDRSQIANLEDQKSEIPEAGFRNLSKVKLNSFSRRSQHQYFSSSINSQTTQFNDILRTKVPYVYPSTKKSPFFAHDAHVSLLYRNHPYFCFEAAQNSSSITVQSSKNTGERKERKLNMSHGQISEKKQVIKTSLFERTNQAFVWLPTSFGLENTYRYLFGSAVKKLNSIHLARKRLKTEPDSALTLHYLKQTEASQNRLTRIHDQGIPRSRNFVIKTSPKQVEVQERKTNEKKQLAKHIITVILGPKIEKFTDLQKWVVRIDIADFVKGCFPRNRLDFSELSQSQYDKILGCLNIINDEPTRLFSPKDILNFINLNQAFDYLEKQVKYGDEWIETVRYFFSGDKLAKQYNYSVFKEKLNQAFLMKFNYQVPLHFNLYDQDTMKEYIQFVQPRSKDIYIYGSQSMLQNISIIKKAYFSELAMKERVKKWKAQASDEPIFRSIGQTSFISQELKSRIAERNRFILGQAKKQRQRSIKGAFIERAALKRSEGLFQ